MKLLNVLLCFLSLPSQTLSTVAQLETMMEKMEAVTYELRDKVELAYNGRCDASLDDCARSNYDNCVSEYPHQTCVGGSYDIEQCGLCETLYDYTESVVRIPENVETDNFNNPTSALVKETVCYTK